MDDRDEAPSEWLFGLRKAARLSQVELAALMRKRGFPWHPTTVQRAEAGFRDPSFQEVAALSEIFGVPRERVAAAQERVARAAQEQARARRELLSAARDSLAGRVAS